MDTAADDSIFCGHEYSFIVAMVPIWFWRNMSFLAYSIAFLLLVAVEFIGVTGMGAQRWIDLGFMRLQPSEIMEIALVLGLAAYDDWLPLARTSMPLWVLFPILTCKWDRVERGDTGAGARLQHCGE